MSCENDVCGTGGWTGPKPGDPDNNVTLHANTVYGGINVSWSFPLTNSHAVAHTILYRGVINDLSKAIQLGYVGGNIYYDRLDPVRDTTYFYWIRIVSINGTTGDPVGPVSAIARPQVQQTLESLTGLIDAGKLAQDLKTDIAGLTTTNTALYQEITDRLMANTAFADALAQVQAGLTQAMTFVSDEITQRIDGDSALVSQLNILAAANQTAMAAIADERTVRVGKDEALAQRIDSMLVTVGDNTAAIQTEQTVRANKDTALAQSISQVASNVGDAATAIRDETTARVSADTALAQRITTTESSLNGNVATGQIGLITNVNTLKNSVTAEYYVKLEANGLLGGFGLLNDAMTVEAGFDVDRFWIGRTGPDKVKPFIIDSGVVYIDKARIRNADIGTLKLAGNSVTVPAFVTSYGSTSGNGNYSMVASVSIVLDQPGMVFASSTGQIAYGTGWTPADTYLTINGTRVSSGGGEEAWVNAAHSGGVQCNAGQVTAQLYFRATDSKARIIDPTIFIMGAKR